MEQLESRVLLDVAFSSLATMVDDRLLELEKGIATVVQTTSALPILGSKIDSLADTARSELASFREGFRTELARLNASDPQAAIERNLRSALRDRDLLHDIGQPGFQDDVNVIKHPSGQIDITINVGNVLKDIAGFTFNLGLPGVGFRVKEGGLTIDAGFAYDQLTIGLNADQSPYFRSDLHDSEFKVLVSASLKRNLKITADLGFLAVSATDASPPRTPELTADLAMDVQGNEISDIRFTDATLNGKVDVNLAIRAAFDTASLAKGSQYPSISTNFVMQWDLNGTSPSAGLTSLGQEPSIRFENVTLNVGSFLSTMLGPVAATIRDFMRPMDPILKIITTEIPVLSDISKEVGLGPVTLKSLAVVAGETAPLPPDYDLLLDLFNASTALHELLIKVDSNKKSLEFNVGSFDLSGKDPRTASFDASLNSINLTDLIPRAVGTLRSVNDQLRESMPAELAPAFNLIDQRLRSAQNGAGFNFPIFDDPMTGVFKLLIGQDTDFVNYTARFHIDGNRTQFLPLPVPLLPNILTVRLNVQYDADAYLKVGYDTYGLRKFLKHDFDVGQLANGLYFDAQEPLLAMSGSVSAGLSASLIPPVKVPVFGIEIPTPPNVSINGEISANNVVVSWGSDNSKFRVLEEDPDPLFNTQGLIKAAFTFVVEAGIPGVPTIELYKKILSERVLFDLYSGELSNPKNPFIPPPTAEDPVVDVKIDLTRPKNRWNWPNHLQWAGNDGQPDSIEVNVVNGFAEVRLNGFLLERHRHNKNLGTFWIKGTEDDDSLMIDGELNRELTFEAGLGVNGLTLDDRGIGGGTRTSMEYTVSQGLMQRRAIDTIGNFISGNMPITHSRVTHLTLYTSDQQGTSVSISELYNNDLNVALGRYENSVTIDTTFGGWADQVTLTSPLNLGLPFRPKGPTRLVVKDRTEAENFLHGRGHYVVTDERLTRQKFMPLDPDNPLLSDGGTGATTINYSEIVVVDFTLQGGDRGNNIDLQSTSLAGAFRLNGGAGDDTFTIGQVHATLPGAIGLERRQIGFATVDMTINGGGGLADKLILDDTGSDHLPYKVTSTYEVWNNFVGLVSVQDFGTTSNSVSGRFFFNFIEDVTVKTGGDNTVNVRDTVSAPDLFVDRGQTTIVGGSHTDVINVLRTTGGLTVDGGGGSNFITIGAVHNDTGSLDLINGDVRLVGQSPGALNFVTIMDKLNDLGLQYSLDETLLERTGGGQSAKYVLFDGMAIFALAIRCGDGGNTFRIDGTPTPDPAFGTQIDIYTGDNDDLATVRGTSGPVSLNLGQGVYQTVSFGGGDTSLDAIRGDFTVTGGGFIDASVSNEASTASHYVNIDQSVFFRQTLDRYIVVDEQVQYLNRIRFASFEELRLQYTAGRGGDAVFITAVDPKATVLAFGADGVLDTWGVGFGANMNKIQGPVFIYGQTADHDFSYYYDYLDTSPHSYQFRPHSLDPQALVAERTGIAPVTFTNLNQVIFYSPVGGGSTTRVQAVPAQMLLNMAVGDGDVVTLGANAPAPSLAGILGAVSVGPGAVNGKARLILDDSGNTTTARDATLTPSVYDGIPLGTIAGFAPGTVLFRDQANWVVDIRAGALDDRFRIGGEFNSATSIDGGGGVNTLDYLSVWDRGVTPVEDGGLGDIALGAANGLVSLYSAQGSANDSVGSSHGIIHGNVSFVPGRVGQAFDFDGVGDYVDLGNDASINLPGSLSVSLWVNLDTLDHYKYLFADFNAAGNTSQGALGAGNEFVPGAPAGGPWFYWYQTYTDGTRDFLFDTTALELNRWYHLVAVRDDAAKTVQLFVDGVEKANLSYAGKSIVPLQRNKFLGGAGPDFPPDDMDGQLDEVAIYNRALSLSEVRTLYVHGSAESDTVAGQVSWWKAEANADDSIDGNHGTLVGGVTFADGRSGQAFEFDGVDDFVRVNNAPNLEPATISVEAWVKMADVNSEGYILAKGASESLASSYYFYVGDGLTFNIFSEGFFSQDSGAIIRSFAGSPADGSIYDGQWHHIVGTYDGAMVRLFVDGSEIGEGTPATFDIGYDMSVSNDLFVGSYNGTFGFDGLIDEVSIFNRALSAAEVLARFNGQAGGTPPAGPGVYVNLQTQTASGLAGGVSNIDNVIGSAGDDILVGNGGNVLDGGAGRDLLIAGDIASLLLGGGGEDLLIAGTTAYDLDASALAAIHAEWRRADIDYETRVANLTTDNGAPVPKLIASDTVESNGGGNTLFGDDDTSDDNAFDLFFASFDLDFYDSQEGERLISI
jgi:hypothetical protein